MIEEMNKDETMSKKCFNRQKADGPNHHNARTRLVNFANRGDRASKGSVPGKKVWRMYSGAPSRVVEVPALGTFCKPIVSRP